MRQAVVGVDIGGTSTVVGVFDEAMELVAKREIPTLKPDFPTITDKPTVYFDYLAETIQVLVGEAGYAGYLSKVGAGVPGRVDPIQGKALGASNLGWANVAFAEEMNDRLGVPVYIDNDVRIYTLGEMIAGAGRGFTNIIGVTLGTGMAAALIIDGKMVRGADFYAGELGHDSVPGNSFLCNCGKQGCLETIASASGIARLAQEAVASGRETCLYDIKGNITSYDVYQACLNGDPFARELFRHVGTTLAGKLLTTVYLLNPEVIIIGGGVAAAGEFLLTPIRTAIADNYPKLRGPKVCIGELGDSAGLIGAAAFASRRSSYL
jgi:glucokinase